MRRLMPAALACLSLAGCLAHRPVPEAKVALPPLRLSPASLGDSLAVQQRLHFQFGGQQRDLDALLEVDAHDLRLAVQAMGQSGVRLNWDGHELRQQRASWLPEAVRGERVLDDLQFALWPSAAIRAALPAGWSLQDDGGERSLRHAEDVWLVVTRVSPTRMQLENRAEGYRLDIETPSQEETTP